MTQRDDESARVRERIKKLLNLAEDAGAMEGEIRNAMAFARRLALEHNVDLDTVRADEEPKGIHEIAAAVEATAYDSLSKQTEGTNLTRWESTLAWAITELVGTVKWYIDRNLVVRRDRNGLTSISSMTGRPKQARQIVFYGPADDVRDVVALLDEWSLTIMTLARMKFGGAILGDGRNYAEGFADALYSQVMAMKRAEAEKVKALAPGGSLDVARLASGSQDERALVLRDRPEAVNFANANALMLAKKEKAIDWLKRVKGITLSKASGGGYGGSYNPEARREGFSDGSKTSLTHSRKPRLGGGK